MTNSLIPQLWRNLAAERAELAALVELAKRHRRDFSVGEQKRAVDIKTRIGEIEERIDELTEQDQRNAQAAEVTRKYGLGFGDGRTGTSIGSRGADTVYSRGSGNSYFRDLASSAMPGSPDFFEATRRLGEHAQMIERAAADLPDEFRAGPGKVGHEMRANPSRVDGQGGYFVPPLWLVDQYVPYLRAGKTTANLFTPLNLPPGTDSVNLPKISAGSIVGYQGDNGAVPSADPADSVVTGPVRTFAGQVDIAMQLLDQSPISEGFDEVMFRDLISAYNQQVDLGCLYGTGAGLQVKGFTVVPSQITVTYTDGSPAAYKLFAPLGQVASQVATQRLAPITAYVMHPRRWYWIATGLDTNNRPLAAVDGSGGQNALVVYDEAAAQGLAGRTMGVPIYVDANVTTTVGGNQDVIYACKFDDLYLFEGAVRTRALMEVLSGTLQVRVQLYNYAATIVDRYPQAIGSVSGTGLAAPSGY